MEKSPDAFRTISEAADELAVAQHVLRFWETKFSFIRSTCWGTPSSSAASEIVRKASGPFATPAPPYS